MTRPLRPAVLAAGLLLLTACSGDDPTAGVRAEPSAPAVSAPAAPSPTAAASPAAPSVPPPSATPSATAAPPSSGPMAPFRATTGDDTERATGGPLTVVAARVARQAGYDRVVFELRGRPGQPGWRVGYVEQAVREGSGARVDVAGDATLQVLIDGVGYPFDTGQQELTRAPAVPGGTAVVRQVVTGGTFEGSYQAFVGLASQRPFRVFRLADPARVVIDVRHR